jgi:hypothetical protein
MKTVKINSGKYPGIGLIVSDRPKIGGKGSFEFATNTPYTVTEAVVGEIRQQIAGFREGVRKHLTVEVTEAAESETALRAGAVDAPQRAEAPPPAEPTSPPEPVAGELSDEDQALVEVEVEKLLAKDTIAEREPLLVATAANEDLPKALRLAYLDAVIAHDDVQKGIKTTAEEWKETIEGAG